MGDKAFEAVFSDDPAKVEAIRSEADKAREGAMDDKPDEVETEEADTTPAAAPSAAKEPEPKEEPKEAPKEEARPRTVPHEALHAERKRREAAEARLAELEKKPKTSVLDDEDKAFNERLSEAVAPVRSQFFELTVELAKEKPGREDYDEIYAFMNAECEKHPELTSQIVNARNPGEEIYRVGKVRKELADVGGDLSKYRDRAVSKTQAELDAANARIKALEAEVAGKKASEEKRARIPQSLNAEASTAQNEEVFRGQTPLKEILPKI